MKKTPIYRKLYITGGIILAILVLLALPFTLPLAKGYTVLRVETDSMEPNYPVGSILYIAPVEDYTELHVGDVISFKTDSSSSQLTTHRIAEVRSDGSYITKGDNNPDNDLYPVSFERIQGKVVLGISALGAVAPLFQSLYGRILLGVMVLIAVGFWLLGDYCKKQAIKNGEIEDPKNAPKEKGPNFKYDYVTIGLVCIGLGLICFGASKLITINSNNNESKELYNSLESQFVEISEEIKDDLNPSSEVTVSEAGETSGEWYELVSVNFEKLKNYNSDIIGWLYFEDGTISYPLLYSGDNTTYYRHNVSKNYDVNGAIFIEAYNKPDMSDSNTFIYGHNMQNFSMFGKLRYYRLNPSYYYDHQYFQVVQEDKVLRYHIFAFEEVNEDSSLFSIFRSGGEEFGKYIATAKSLSYIDSGIEVGNYDSIVTLVTCNGNDGMRFLMHAVLEDEYDITE